MLGKTSLGQGNLDRHRSKEKEAGSHQEWEIGGRRNQSVGDEGGKRQQQREKDDFLGTHFFRQPAAEEIAARPNQHENRQGVASRRQRVTALGEEKGGEALQGSTHQAATDPDHAKQAEGHREGDLPKGKRKRAALGSRASGRPLAQCGTYEKARQHRRGDSLEADLLHQSHDETEARSGPQESSCNPEGERQVPPFPAGPGSKRGRDGMQCGYAQSSRRHQDHKPPIGRGQAEEAKEDAGEGGPKDQELAGLKAIREEADQGLNEGDGDGLDCGEAAAHELAQAEAALELRQEWEEESAVGIADEVGERVEADEEPVEGTGDTGQSLAESGKENDLDPLRRRHCVKGGVNPLEGEAMGNGPLMGVAKNRLRMA